MGAAVTTQNPLGPRGWFAVSAEPRVMHPPLSKSDAHRALVLADLMGRPAPLGEVTDQALPTDVKIMRDGLWALRHQKETLAVHDAGAPFRLLLTQAALTPGTDVQFSGTERLAHRPHHGLLEALRTACPSVRIEGREGAWPIRVTTPAQPFHVSEFAVDASHSSQFASSLLLGCARLVHRHGRPSGVRLVGPVASSEYLEMSIRWLEDCGFTIENEGALIRVTEFHEPRAFPPVPGDWSALTYLLPIAWRRQWLVEPVSLSVSHPDKRIVEQLRSVGLELRFVGRHRVAVVGALDGALSFDASLAPDLTCALVALSTALPMRSRFTRIGILRHKESDRVEGLKALAEAQGAQVEVSGDTMTVRPGGAPRAFAYDARHDHRLAMAAVTASVLNASALTLTGAESVAKSFPRFFDEVGL